MSKLQDVKTVIFDKNLNLLVKSDPIYTSLFGNITALTEFNSLLAKNEMHGESFLTKLNMSGKEYHVCYKCIDLEETFEFHFFLLSDEWVVVNPSGRYDIHDQLTNLLTERSLLSLVAHELKRTHRNRDLYTALLMDIGHMKDINEMFGYVKGDITIKTVAETLQKITRGSDALGRYQGDKFIVLLHKTDRTGALQYIAKLTKALQKVRFHFDDNVFHAKINYGIASSQENDTVEILLDRLEKSLKSTKKSSSSHIEYFS